MQNYKLSQRKEDQKGVRRRDLQQQHSTLK